jgi:hypothetical protein
MSATTTKKRGRPKKPGRAALKLVPLNSRVPQKLVRAMHVYAAAEGITRQEALAFALETTFGNGNGNGKSKAVTQ